MRIPSRGCGNAGSRCHGTSRGQSLSNSAWSGNPAHSGWESRGIYFSREQTDRSRTGIDWRPVARTGLGLPECGGDEWTLKVDAHYCSGVVLIDRQTCNDCCGGDCDPACQSACGCGPASCTVVRRAAAPQPRAVRHALAASHQYSN